MLKRAIKEPLVHFAALALLIFAGYGFFNNEKREQLDRIVVESGKIQQLSAVFSKIWLRQPIADELKALVDDYVKEEIYVREALALGLDKDDTVIRRRLRVKMEFLSEADAGLPTPTDIELYEYLKNNSRKFEIEPSVAFEQVYFDPARRGEMIDHDSAFVLKTLMLQTVAEPAALGDVTLLPTSLPLTARQSIAYIFGAEFAEALLHAGVGQWSGPIKSTFGSHLVRVIERKPGRTPALEEVRSAVTEAWTGEKRAAIQRQHLDQLLKRYQVTIEEPLKRRLADDAY
jgi:PPIC-type PPIASE domain